MPSPAFAMELKDVQYFIGVAEAGSFAVAATDLRVARPALSRRIKKIEDYAGTELFSRLPRGVKLTGAGELFLGHCRRILQEVVSAEMALRQDYNYCRGQVALGISQGMASLIGPPLIEAARKQFPNLTLKILAASSHTQVAQLLDGYLDLAFLVTGTIDAFHLPRVKVIPMFADPLVVVSAPQPLRSKPYTVEDLAAERILLNIAAGDLLRRQAPGLYRKLNIECETDSDETVRSLVLGGKGITLCPLRVYHEDLMQGRMTAFSISGTHVYVTLGLAYLEDRLSGQMRGIVQITKSQVQELLDRGVIVSANPSGRKPGKTSREISSKHPVRIAM